MSHGMIESNRRRFLVLISEPSRGNPGAISGFPRIVRSSRYMKSSPCADARREFQMTVILHDSVRDLYFVGPNMWTNDRAKAHDFGRMDHAVGLARRAGLMHLELVLSFRNVPGDLRLPLAEACSAEPAQLRSPGRC
jgi:hypothetical protein